MDRGQYRHKLVCGVTERNFVYALAHARDERKPVTAALASAVVCPLAVRSLKQRHGHIVAARGGRMAMNCMFRESRLLCIHQLG
jgi:hypothetical protein